MIFNTTINNNNNNNPSAMDPKFYSELKQLNEDLIKFLQQSHEKSVYMDYTPTLEDYIKQFSALEKQYPAPTGQVPLFGTATATATATTTTTTTASTVNTSAASLFSSSTLTSTAPLTFGTPAAAATATTTTSSSSASSLAGKGNTTFTMPTATQPFLFGAPPAFSSASTGAAPTTTTASPFFSFAASAGLNNLGKKDEQQTEEGSAAATGDDDEPHQPPEPVIEKYEEPNAKHSVKCKLYERVKGGELNLLGIGTLYVKSMDASVGLQVIVRQDPDLRRVLLNEVVIPSIPVKLLPKAVQMVFPNPSGESKFCIAKLKDEAEAQVLFETLKQG